MWPFSRKTALPPTTSSPEPRVFTVPPEHTEQALRLLDEWQRAPRPGDNLARYQFWEFIGELFPDTKVGGHRWRWEFYKSSELRIIETSLEA